MSVTVMELFDGAYELMTTMLLRFFAHSDESDQALTTLVQSAIDLMFAAVRPLGVMLTALPAGDAHGGATTGPSFALHRPVSLIPHRRAAWLVLHERLVELADFARRLDDEGGPDALAEVAAGIDDVARTLEPHLERRPLLPT